MHNVSTVIATHPSLANNNVSLEDQVIQQALVYLEQRITANPIEIKNPTAVSSFLRLALGREKREVFAVIFLDTQHRMIAFEKLFYGSIASSAVYPRIVVQRALAHNAAAVILAHNHPSNNVEPSLADKDLTTLLINTLFPVEVRVLDHIIVSEEKAFSFFCEGLLVTS